MTGEKTDAGEIILQPDTGPDGRQSYRSSFAPDGSGKTKVLMAEQPAVIPVVFLPGIMGTNLRNKSSGEAVWRPPNVSFRPTDIMAILGALMTWPRYGAKRRQQLLDGEAVEVDDRGSISTGNSGLSRDTARERGWGTVSRSSYNPIMARLQESLNSIVRAGNPEAWWAGEGARDPADYGEELGGNEPLSTEELQHASLYQFDVWCCGYNWLKSNRDSAEHLKGYIEHTVLAHYRSREDVADQVDDMKVILVTHSMGGLVARALKLVENGDERVLGVVHGVQPATGAPAIYHHMRCGYEGFVRFILGRNAGQVTAVSANSAGAMELTPSFDHHDGKPWLFACKEGEWDPESTESMPLRLPLAGNPYEEIYKSPEWYGLVPRQNEKYLDLSGGAAGSPERGLRFKFDVLVDKVGEFHADVSRNYHSLTYAHYGADEHEDMHSWRDVVWQGDVSLLGTPGGSPEDDGRGSYRRSGMKGAPRITAVEGAGDGTVCDRSGAAPGRAGVQASFRHGQQGSGQFNNSIKGYDHQGSYNDKHGSRTEWMTLFSIAKISKEADWHPEAK